MAVVEVAFVGGLVEVCGSRLTGFVVVLVDGAAAAAAVADASLPSGAIERVVVC